MEPAFALVKSVSFNREGVEKYHPRLIRNIITHSLGEVQLDCSLVRVRGVEEEGFAAQLAVDKLNSDRRNPSFFRSILLICLCHEQTEQAQDHPHRHGRLLRVGRAAR